jgi:hypothetical protein
MKVINKREEYYLRDCDVLQIYGRFGLKYCLRFPDWSVSRTSNEPEWGRILYSFTVIATYFILNIALNVSTTKCHPQVLQYTYTITKL